MTRYRRNVVLALAASLALWASEAAADAVDFAVAQVGKPYALGKAGPDAFDCSGLTQAAFRQVGIELPRTSKEQSEIAFGQRVTSGFQRGDLLFYATDDSQPNLVTHVGIAIGDGTWVSAQTPLPKPNGAVLISPIGSSYWAPRFLFALRIQTSTPVPTPDEPVARDDSGDGYKVRQGETLVIPAPGVLGNDTVPSNFVSVLWTSTVPGFIDLGGGSFSYTPPVGITGTVELAYSIHTATLDSVPARVTITVLPPVVLPVANDDSGGIYQVTQGGTLVVPAPGVLANDSLPAGATPVVEFLPTAPPGTFTPGSDGGFTYTSPSTFVGSVVLTYLIHTSLGNSNSVTVTIEVTEVTTGTRYSVTDLGVLSDANPRNSEAYALSNPAVASEVMIAGLSRGRSNEHYIGCTGSGEATKPVIWTASGGIQVLEPSALFDNGIPGSVPFKPCGGVARGVNALGQVVGVLDFGSGSGSGNFQSFIWTPGEGMQIIAGTSRGQANDINNLGQVVGVSGGGAFRWSVAGGFESLGVLAQNSGAAAINDLGVVVGAAGIEACNAGPVMWDAEKQLSHIDLSVLLATLPAHNFACNGRGTDINNNNAVVGTVNLILTSGENTPIAFIYRDGVAQSLGEVSYTPEPGTVAGTEADSINDAEQVVGQSNGRAFVWSSLAGIIDLNSLLDQTGIDWTLLRATAINNAGEIVGYGSRNGEIRAFLLTPVVQ